MVLRSSLTVAGTFTFSAFDFLPGFLRGLLATSTCNLCPTCLGRIHSPPNFVYEIRPAIATNRGDQGTNYDTIKERYCYYLRELSALRSSLSLSRFFMASRLSYIFLPFATPTSTFTRPFLKYSFNGIRVSLFDATSPARRRI